MLMLCFSPENAPGLHVIIMGVLCLTPAVLVSLDIWHPYCWYGVFFFLYACSYSISSLIGGVFEYGYNKEVMVLQALAYCIFILVIPVEKSDELFIDYEKNVTVFYDVMNSTNALKLFVAICKGIVFLAALFALKGGYYNKSEMYGSGSYLIFFGTRFSLLLTIIYIYMEISALKSTRRIDFWQMISCGIPIIAFSLFSGERDRAFIFIVATVYVLYYSRKLKKKYFVVLVPVFSLLIPLSSKFKYFFLAGRVRDSVDISSVDGLISTFFGGEFSSVGRNLHLLVNNASYTKSYFHGASLLNDIVRVFLNVGKLHGAWFQKNITHTTGYGFTIVGEGYVNFGYFGVVIIASIIGLLIRWIYKKAKQSEYWLMLYVYAIPVFIYAIRADLGNILSPLLIHGGIAVIVVYYSRRMKVFE